VETLGIDLQNVLFAGLAGFIPAAIWLVFWLREDKKRPEPKGLILLAFGAGMAGVIVVLPFQGFAANMVPMGFLLILIWAAIEEIAKFGLAWIAVLQRSAVDEPIDVPVYMITVALGFSALENALFLFNPLRGGNFAEVVLTGDLRFIGASLIHVLASAVVGGALAFVFYRELPQKIWYGFSGIILAVALHALFNFLIMTTGASRMLTVFLGVWVGIIMLLLALERIKTIHRPLWWEKVFMSTNG
jgi:protease PrsW